MDQQNSSSQSEVCGRYHPGTSWAELGCGELWMRDAATHQVINLPDRVRHWLTDKSSAVTGSRNTSVGALGPGEDQVLRLGAADFVRVLARLGSAYANGFEPSEDEEVERAAGAELVLAEIKLSPGLEVYIRSLRLSAETVAKKDIAAFAAPSTYTLEDVFDTCLRVSQYEDDAPVSFAQTESPFAARWLPLWQNEQLMALRLVYLSEAEDAWWRGKGDAEDISLHLDAWIWVCTDTLTRDLLTDNPPSLGAQPTKSTYQISYRGEDEVLEVWKSVLWQPDAEQTFEADGWLVWRTLKQAFQGSGWRPEVLRGRSGRHFHQLEFQLMPPANDSPTGNWRMIYFVGHVLWEAREPLARWWLRRDRTWTIGRERLHGPDTWFLPALYEAGQVVPAIQKSLLHPAPCECEIAADEVFELVQTQLPMLVERGFAVRAPDVGDSAWKNVRIRVFVRRPAAKTHTKGAAGRAAGTLDLQQLVEFDWSVVIGDEEVSREQFETMVRQQAPYVQINGTWQLVPLDAVMEHIRFLQSGAKADGTASLLQLSRFVLMNESMSPGEEGAVAVEYGFEDETSTPARTLDSLIRGHAPELLPPPSSFVGQLREYQRYGYSWLMHLRQIGVGGCLADDMGLGKTIQVLAYFLHLSEIGASTRPHLLVCPTSLLQNWRAEVHRFAPTLSIYMHHGPGRNLVEKDGRHPLVKAAEEYDLVMTTYATIVRDIDDFEAQDWDTVVLDEAQNVKNAQTKQAQAVRRLHAVHRLALTGTPVENRLEELWSIFHFTTPGYLGSLAWFRKVFASPIANRPNLGRSRQLHQLLRPILLRRRKTEPSIQMELPEKWELLEHSVLTTEQASLYQTVVNKLFDGIHPADTGMSRRGQILAALVRLKQICDHPCLVVAGDTSVRRSGKLKLLLSLLEDVIEEGDSALVFTQFREMGDILCSSIEAVYGFRPQFLHGGLTALARGQMVDQFQSGEDKSPVLVLSLKAGGVGLNLTRANHVFHFDRWWNPAVEDQATDRAFRIGQSKNVQVHKLVCAGTLEERIDALIRSKRQLSAAVVGESEGWITELDNDSLRRLFMLDPNAAMEDED